MTRTNAHQPDDFPQTLLAAYVDGELDEHTRAQVELWLSNHPESLADLADQRELGPGNIGLWEQAEAPEPSYLAWMALRRGIDAGLIPATPTRPTPPASPVQHGKQWWALGGLVIAGMAAAIAWVAFGSTMQHAPQSPAEVPKAGDLVAQVTPQVETRIIPDVAPEPRVMPPTAVVPTANAILAIATDDDVILERVPDTGEGWLPVGRHPAPEVLLLASIDEVQLHDADPSPAWPKGGPRIVHAPGVAPMIYAASQR